MSDLSTDLRLIQLAMPMVNVDQTKADNSTVQSHAIQNRRYIGGKFKLLEWIFSNIEKECYGAQSFADIFAGTGVVAAAAAMRYKKIIINDFLHSNNVIYQAFFTDEKWSKDKIVGIINEFNSLDPYSLEDNYFSLNYGNKYFSHATAKSIGYIRDSIEAKRKGLTNKEYFLLVASLIYSVDKIANTVGHYDAYFKKEPIERKLQLRLTEPIPIKGAKIFREDANKLARRVKADIVYIDPPYNSRQYSRFYHVLETIAKNDRPELYGTALKPATENRSEYSTTKAPEVFADLIENLDAKYLVVSYNNTYRSKSSSSKNKIQLEEIRDILERRGPTKTISKQYKHFNAGNTQFDDHREYLFITKVA